MKSFMDFVQNKIQQNLSMDTTIKTSVLSRNFYACGVQPGLVLLLGDDGLLAIYGGAIFAPEDLGTWVGLDLHPQLHILVQPGRDVAAVVGP